MVFSENQLQHELRRDPRDRDVAALQADEAAVLQQLGLQAQAITGLPQQFDDLAVAASILT